MSLTLGLNTAISGMMTNQRQLDVIAQNVSNVNTAGFTRKVLNQESRVLAGYGAGVQTGSIRRSVDEGLLQHLRSESGKLAEVKAVDQYLERLGQQFGTPADNTSISHMIEKFADAMELLANEVGRQSSYLGVVRNALDATDQINRMNDEIQQLRSDADQRIEDVVILINNKIDEIHTLNNLIIKNNATGAGTEDLLDKRDALLNDLSEFIDIKYYETGEGGLAVYTASGMLMIDSTPQYLEHTALTKIDANATKADGSLDGIHINGIDITSDIRSGELKGLIQIRDEQLTDFQAGLDQLAQELVTRLNQVHNRGTTHPDLISSMTGTRYFADQDNISQQIRLSGTAADTMLTIFDTTGDQVAAASLDTIMTTAYGVGDLAAQPSRGWWTINEVTAHVQAWLQASGYPSAASATVALNSDGQLDIDLANTDYSLSFRDQASGTAGGAAQDVTIEFDMDGDSTADTSVDGFSNFFGLNDFFTTEKHRYIYSSAVFPEGTTTTVNRTIRLYDQTGQIGSSVTVSAGSTLDDIAAAINRRTKTVDSKILSPAYTVPLAQAGQTFSLQTPSGSYGTYTAVAGHTLNNIATIINGWGLTATVVDDGTGERLRVTDSSGSEIVVSGAFGSELGMTNRQLIEAAVIPEGAGYRLRLKHSEAGEVYIGANVDGAGKSLLTDLDIGPAASSTAATLTVRRDLVESPYLVSRGAVQFDTVTNKYFIREGDNSTALSMAEAATSKSDVLQAGNIGKGSFTLTEYGATLTGLTAREHSVVKDRLDYQSKLKESVQFQHESMSGVNIDEEVANLITYQQAYAASAKVISTLQEMLEVLTGMIR